MSKEKGCKEWFILKFSEFPRLSPYIYGAEKQETGKLTELWEINAGKPRVVLLP